MAKTWTARSVERAMELLRTEAQDGDTIRLAWPAASQFTKLALESTAMGLGLDVVVVVPGRVTGGGNV